MSRTTLLRVGVGIFCTAVLLVIFLYQRFDWCAWLGIGVKGVSRFIINRSIRFFLNDIAAIGIIFSLFYRRSFVRIAVMIQLASIVLFLAPYFILKLNFPSYNGPLINFLHRLILNPMLMMLLIPALYYQKMKEGSLTSDSR